MAPVDQIVDCFWNLQEARQLDLPQASKQAEKALVKLLQTRELKNLRSASAGDDEMQLRNAIKEA